MLGARLGHALRPRALGGRAAQHVEADAAARTVVPWRQPHAIAPLLAVPRAAAQGTDGRPPDAGVLRRADATQALEEMPLTPELIEAYENADYVEIGRRRVGKECR